jgi:hypothetical protein
MVAEPRPAAHSVARAGREATSSWSMSKITAQARVPEPFVVRAAKEAAGPAACKSQPGPKP